MKAQKRGIVVEIGERRVAFALAFVILFAVSFGFLSLVGATPEAPSQNTFATTADSGSMHIPGRVSNAQGGAQVTAATPQGLGEVPVRIKAPSIGLDVSISNPSSTAIDALDQALLSGAVRYPTSGLLGAPGTVLLFGHSSYLPIVHNQAYKAFDGIQDLKPGDTISVFSNTHEYRYSVVGVKFADASKDVIELPLTGEHLTLVTCDSFASKTDRFVVTADLAGTYNLN